MCRISSPPFPSTWKVRSCVIPPRLALLKQAKQAGLDQFHANLIITAAQHRAGERIPRQPVPKNTWLSKLGIALILQAWIIAGLWWLLAG